MGEHSVTGDMHFHLTRATLDHLVHMLLSFFRPESLTDFTILFILSLLVAARAESEAARPLLIALAASFFLATVLTLDTEFAFEVGHRVARLGL
jgi:hypothetical protein